MNNKDNSSKRQFKQITFILFFLGFPFFDLSAQCPSGDIQFSTQEEVDNFLSAYPNCTTIHGDLEIGSSNGSTITNLNGLKNITTISRALYIAGNPMKNLKGLNNLSSVGDLFIIYDNDELTNLDDLNSLTTLGVNSFDRLTITDNDKLKNLDGLINVTSQINLLFIRDNDSLTNIDGLANIASIFLGLSINDNASLANLDGLKNLPLISNIVGSQLVFDIFNNPSLNSCSSPLVCDFLLNYNTRTNVIYNNAPGCDNEMEVLEECDDKVPTSNLSMLNSSIAPNPFINEITITNLNGQIFNYQLIDLEGRILRNGILKEKNNRIDLNNIDSGIYYLRVIDQKTNSIFVEKMIKI